MILKLIKMFSTTVTWVVVISGSSHAISQYQRKCSHLATLAYRTGVIFIYLFISFFYVFQANGKFMASLPLLAWLSNAKQQQQQQQQN